MRGRNRKLTAVIMSLFMVASSLFGFPIGSTTDKSVIKSYARDKIYTTSQNGITAEYGDIFVKTGSATYTNMSVMNGGEFLISEVANDEAFDPGSLSFSSNVFANIDVNGNLTLGSNTFGLNGYNAWKIDSFKDDWNHYYMFCRVNVTATASVNYDAELPYTGSAQNLLKSGTATNGTMKYSLNNSSWSNSIPTGTSVGTYTVYYYAAGTNGYKDSAKNYVTVKIKAGDPTYSVTGVNTNYDGQNKNLVTVSGNGGTLHYRYKRSTDSSYSSWSTSVPTAKNAGTYNIQWYAESSAGFNAMGSSSSPYSVDAKINKGNVPAPSGLETTYGNTLSAVTLPAGWTWVSPTTKVENVGNNSFKANYVDSTGNYNNITNKDVSVKVNPKSVSLTWTNTEFTYDGNSHVPSASVSSGLINGDTCTVASISGAKTDVGNHTATAESLSNSNYTIDESTKTAGFSITKSQATANVTPASNLVYSGNAQNLVSSGTSNYGNVVYSLSEGGTYSSTIPTGTEAKTYTVYYKVNETNNYYGTGGHFDVSIAKAGITPVISLTDWTYGDNPNQPSVSGVKENADVTYTYAVKGSDDFSSEIPTDAGEYTVKADISGTANYNGNTATKDFKIIPKPVTVTANGEKTFMDEDPNLTYTVNEGLVGDDTLSGIIIERDPGEDAGDYVVNVSLAEGSSNPNYSITCANGTFKIKRKIITPEVRLSPVTFTYNMQQQIPNVDVFYGMLVIPQSDYVISYSENGNTYSADVDASYSTDVGDYFISISPSASGNFVFDESQGNQYTINPKDISGDDFTMNMDEDTYTYDGDVKKPALSLIDGNIEINAGTDYEIDASSVCEETDAGDYTIRVNGIGNYTGERSISWKINKADIAADINDVTATYDGNSYSVDVTIPGDAFIKYGSEPDNVSLDENPEYKDAGIHTVYYEIDEGPNYNVKKGSANVVINRKEITVTTEDAVKIYKDKDPEFSYSISENGLVEGDKLENITFTREEGENVGEYIISAYADEEENPNYVISFDNSGKLTINPKRVNNIKIIAKDMPYTGSEIKPEITIFDGEDIIPESEYKIECSDNLMPGTARVRVYDIYGGNYIIEEAEAEFIIIDPGIISVVNPEKPNACGAALSESPSEIISKIDFTEEDVAAQADGKNIYIFLEVTDISGSVGLSDKKLIEGSLKEGMNVGMYLDLSLFKQIEGENKTKIETTKGAVKVSFEIPENLRKDGRTFYIIRVHDGEADIITPVQNGNLLTFETDRFSTYALTYVDPASKSDKESVKKTGDAFNMGFMLVVLITSAVGITFILTKKLRKRP